MGIHREAVTAGSLRAEDLISSVQRLLESLLNGDFKNLVLSEILEPAVGLEPTKTALQTVAFSPLATLACEGCASSPKAGTMPGEFLPLLLRTRRPFEPDMFRCWD